MDEELIFYRTDPARNMARFYGLALMPSLFGDVSLVRRWGRIGTRGSQIVELHPDRHAAAGALQRHAHLRRRRGYRLA